MSDIASRKSFFRTIIVLSFGALVLSACEKVEPGYFPLNKGWTWQYNIENQTVNELAKQKEIIQNMGAQGSGEDRVFISKTISGIVSHYSKSDSALRLTYQLSPNNTGKKPEEVSATIFRYPLVTGSHWQDVITTNSLQSYDAYAHAVVEEIPVKVSIESMDETVVVPAGKFKYCMRIVSKGEKLIQKGKYAYQPTMTISITNTRWYAEGVGLIKEKHVEESDVLQYRKASYIITLDKYKSG